MYFSFIAHIYYLSVEVCMEAVSVTHTFNGSLSGTTWVSRYQKGRTNLDFTKARDSEWQWHQPYASMHLAPDSHASTPPLKIF